MKRGENCIMFSPGDSVLYYGRIVGEYSPRTFIGTVEKRHPDKCYDIKTSDGRILLMLPGWKTYPYRGRILLTEKIPRKVF